MKHEIIVFLGPSLPLPEAKAILPEATYLAPVRCGDILRALRLAPKILVIIDGFFESTAAVWHKEILWALEQGVVVYGASSMGALRAAELSDYGMLGVGKIYQAYVTGLLVDDDEVCVMHRPAASAYTPISEALVNIRASLEYALTSKAFDQECISLLLSCAKETPYKRRSWASTLAFAEQRGLACEVAQQFHAWLNTGGYINQKSHDALALLTQLAKLKPEECTKTADPIKTHESSFFRSLQMDVACRPLNYATANLAEHEKIAMCARLLGVEYILNRSLAYGLACGDALVNSYSAAGDNEAVESFKESIVDLSFHEEAFRQRITRFDQLFDRIKDRFNEQSLNNIHHDLMLYFFNEPASIPNERAIKALNYLTKVIALLHWHLQQLGFILNQVRIKELTPILFEENSSGIKNLIADCVMSYGFDESRFEQSLVNLYVLHECLLKCRLAPFSLRANSQYEWLQDALRLSGTYQAAKELLANKGERDKAISLIHENRTKELDEYLYDLDFLGHETEFGNFISGLDKC